MEFPFRISPIEEAKCDLWYGRYIDTSHQKRSGISRGVQDRATPGGFSMGLCVFYLGISKGVTQFCRISRGVNFVFSRISVINDHMIHRIIV